MFDATPDVPVSTIDLSTVRVAGLPVATLAGRPLAVARDLDRDGDADLVVLVRNDGAALPVGLHDVHVTASLRDGRALVGNAWLRVLPTPRWHGWPTR